jgi:hypothetical protein
VEILYLCGFDPNDLLQADWPNASGVQQTSINEDRKRGLFQASLPKRPYSVRRGRGRLRRRRQSGLTGDRLPGSTASSCRRPPECLAAPVGILEIDAIGTSSVGKRPRSTASLSRLSNCDRISLFIALWFGRIEVDHAAPAPPPTMGGCECIDRASKRPTARRARMPHGSRAWLPRRSHAPGAGASAAL